MKKTKNFAATLLLVLLGTTLSCKAAGEQASQYFNDWPEQAQPALGGKRLAENFLKRKHTKRLWYGVAITWHGAFRLAEETGDKSLSEKLIRRFDFYLQPKNEARFTDKFHVDFAMLGVIPIEVS